jgi:phosphoserine phosphatase
MFARAVTAGLQSVGVDGNLLGSDTSWLATCGDSTFDLDMMRAAQLAIGVRPKPDLREALSKLPDAVVLHS